MENGAAQDKLAQALAQVSAVVVLPTRCAPEGTYRNQRNSNTRSNETGTE